MVPTVKLYHAQASDILPTLRDVDLVYIDPLFNTGDVFTMGDSVAFSDRFDNEVDFSVYLRDLLLQSYRALAPHGACVVHCSSDFQPVVRALGDAVFGEPGGFVDQIVWHYRRWPTKSARKLNNLHDYLIRFTKGPSQSARFHQLYQPLAESTLKTWGTKKQRAVKKDGRRTRSESTEEESQGAALGDVWTDIGIIAPSAHERTGYPTQKPEALLRRVIELYSDAGDTVVDPTAGSGTTLAVAAKMDRHAVGIDASPVAFQVARDRLEALTLGNNPITFMPFEKRTS